MFADYHKQTPVIPLSDAFRVFGMRSPGQVAGDLSFVLSNFGKGFQVGLSSVDFIRPDLSFPAYAGMVRKDGLSPVYHLFDRHGGGKRYTQRVTRKWCRDFRGRALTYDEHDGIDFVCPPGTLLCAAAPGTVVMVRDRWLRGGITVAVDHGGGMLTQYTHCWKPLASIGQKLNRGEPVALSGVAGIDMTLFCPWVPPHIHFMAWVNGRPVDPYRAEGEPDRQGAWAEKNDPKPARPAGKRTVPDLSPVDRKAVDEIVSKCSDDKIRRELALYEGSYETLAAILEDALDHDDFAFPEGFRHRSVRPEARDSGVRLSLPLPADTFTGAYFADPKVSLKEKLGW
ncbi:MAG: M23 family metallopeptidase [Thermodesulfobacteriota bacterium]